MRGKRSRRRESEVSAGLARREPSDGSPARSSPGGSCREPDALRGLMAGLVVEAHELIRAQGAGRVGLAVVVAEFHFEHSGREGFDDGTYLSAQKVLVRDVFQEGDHGK